MLKFQLVLGNSSVSGIWRTFAQYLNLLIFNRFYMKRLKTMALAALGFLAASCNNEDFVAGDNGKSDPISFSVDNFKGITKATETSTSNYASQITDFKVIGYFTSDATGDGVNPGARYLGSSDTAPVQINGSGGTYNYATASDAVMWPATTAKLLFQGFTPASGGGLGAIENTVSNNIPHLAVNVTVPTANAEQKDIMFAQADNQTSETNGKKVNMPFEHAMSAIRFSAKTTSSAISATVKSVTMANVISTGKVGYLTDKTLGCSLGTTRASYAIGIANSNGVDVSTTAVDLTSASGTCMMLPQTLSAWDPVAGTPVTSETTKSYIIIECKIKQNDLHVVGDDSNFGKVYIPFGGTWKQGKKYTYTINIGNGSGGYDANGNPLLAPVSFTASASSWSEENSKPLIPAEQTAVNLGLPSGLKWAAGNIGADNPEDYGLYFAWGETTGYTAEQVKSGVRKFDSASYTASAISTDLKPEQDAAHVNLGGNWRMPTKAEFQELIDNCNVTWTNDYNGTGIKGRIFTSKVNGKSVFFPAAGYCYNSSVDDVGSYDYYWSASRYSSYYAWSLSDSSGSMDLKYDEFRYYGYSVRGVFK